MERREKELLKNIKEDDVNHFKMNMRYFRTSVTNGFRLLR